MKGYRFIPDLKPTEVSQLAICMNCRNQWMQKITVTGAFANSTTYQACDKCWDAEKQKWRPGMAGSLAQLAEEMKLK